MLPGTLEIEISCLSRNPQGQEKLPLQDFWRRRHSPTRRNGKSFQYGTNAQNSAQFLINEGQNWHFPTASCPKQLLSFSISSFLQKEGNKQKAQLTGAPQ